MLNGKKMILSLLALLMLIGSAMLALGIVGFDVHSTYAQQPYVVTSQDFYIP